MNPPFFRFFSNQLFEYDQFSQKHSELFILHSVIGRIPVEMCVCKEYDGWIWRDERWMERIIAHGSRNGREERSSESADLAVLFSLFEDV